MYAYKCLGQDSIYYPTSYTHASISFRKTREFQWRAISLKLFYSLIFKKIQDYLAWYLGVSSPPTSSKFEVFWPLIIIALFFKSTREDSRTGELLVPIRRNRHFVAAGSSCKVPPCAVSHPPEPRGPSA